MSKNNAILKIEHFGATFISDENARLIFTGIRHHVVLLVD
jgi:hypothetical protein